MYVDTYVCMCNIKKDAFVYYIISLPIVFPGQKRRTSAEISGDNHLAAPSGQYAISS